MKAFRISSLDFFPKDKRMCLIYASVIFICLTVFGSLAAASAFSRQRDHISRHILIKSHRHLAIIEQEFNLLDASFELIDAVMKTGIDINEDFEKWLRPIFEVNQYASLVFVFPDDGPAEVIVITDDSELCAIDYEKSIDTDKEYITVFADGDKAKASGIITARRIHNAGFKKYGVDQWTVIAVATSFSDILAGLELSELKGADHHEFEYRIKLTADEESVLYSTYSGEVRWDTVCVLTTGAGIFSFESYISPKAAAGRVSVYSLIVFASFGISLTYHAQHMKIIRKSEYIDDLNGKLKDLLITDYLTETKNRRGVYEFLEAFIPYANRNGLPFCVAMLDLDNFKGINDLMGHDGGDRALVFFAERFKSKVRKSDVIGRFGGDEFICVFTDCTAQNAYRLSENFRKTLTTEEFSYGDHKAGIEFSMGITQYKEGDLSENLIWRADEGLYKAKKAGKNRIIVI